MNAEIVKMVDIKNSQINLTKTITSSVKGIEVIPCRPQPTKRKRFKVSGVLIGKH